MSKVAYNVNLYRVTLKRPNGNTWTTWKEARSVKRLRKGVLYKIKDSSWELVGIYFERPATYIPQWRINRNY